MFNLKRLCLLLFIFVFLIQGCSTTQHMVPGRPLKKDEVECRFSIGVSTNNFSLFSMQFGAFKGITDNDALGFTLNNFLIPSCFSYVRYWKKGDYCWNYQFHINDIWTTDFNPEYETDIALSKIDNHSVHSVKIGIGYYTTPLMPWFFGRHTEQTAFVPVLSYQFQNPTIRLEAEAIPGMAKYFVRKYKSPAYLYSDADSINRFEYYRNMKRIYAHNEVNAITQIGDDYKTAAWKIALADGDTVLLENRDPYADCDKCYIDKMHLEAYKASEDSRVLWIYYDEYKRFRSVMAPTLIEVNMKKVIDDFNQGKDLILVSERDLIKNSLKSISPITEDLFISVGHIWSGN